MTKAEQEGLDIALATMARGMFADLLTKDDRKAVAAMKKPEELMALLKGNESWGGAVRDFPENGGVELFSNAMDESLFSDFLELYRFAEGSAREYLYYVVLRLQCAVITSALRRLAEPENYRCTVFVPKAADELWEPGLTRFNTAPDYAAVLSLAEKSIYGPTLSSLPVDEKTGLPDMTEASLRLEECFYSEYFRYLRESYNGPSKEALIASVGFQADMQNMSYLIRLRRFQTPEAKGRELLLPFAGRLTDKMISGMFNAKDKDEVDRILLSGPYADIFHDISRYNPEQALLAAVTAYCRKVIRAQPNLSVADAFLFLKRMEGTMLKRVYTALRYGLEPALYM